MERWKGLLDILLLDNENFMKQKYEFYNEFDRLLDDFEESALESYHYFWEYFSRRFLDAISPLFWAKVSAYESSKCNEYELEGEEEEDGEEEKERETFFDIETAKRFHDEFEEFAENDFAIFVNTTELLIKYIGAKKSDQDQYITWVYQKRRELVHNHLYLPSPPSFKEAIYQFFLYQFQNSSKWYQIDQGEELEDFSETAEVKAEREKLLSKFCPIFSQLQLFIITEPLFTRLFFHQIESLVNNLWGRSETPVLQFLLAWVSNFLYPWLEAVMESEKKQQIQSLSISSWKSRIHFFTLEQFADLKMKEMFDIILGFPESMPSLLDLKECLSKTTQLNQLIQSLIISIKKRLLHSGANTMKIIEVYINTIRSLKLIDPSGVAINRVSDPICDYLRKREDIIRCIVSMFTDEKSDLYRELRSGFGSSAINDGDDSDDDNEIEAWNPAPIDALPSDTRRIIKDIFSVLVNIFGSTDLFVEEYRNMLSDRLLSLIDYDTLKESEILELLKRKFGESSLQNCAIMLKDMKDSQRFDVQFHKPAPGDENVENQNSNHSVLDPKFQLHSFILSYMFWPSFIDVPLTLPSFIQQEMEKYSKKYEVMKRARKLEFYPHLGSVTLELTLRDQTKTFTVKPLYATLIYHFQSKDSWSEEELLQVMGVSADQLRAATKYWINQGFLQSDEKGNYFVRSESQPENLHSQPAEEEEEQSNVQSAEEKKKQMWALCKNFIVSMLTNGGPLPPERIHSFLEIWCHDEYYGKSSVNQLTTYLNTLVKDDVLEFDVPNYAIKKS